MTPVVLMSLASFWSFHPAKAEVSKEVTRAGDWRIEKTTDRFSGDVACVVRRGDASVRHGSLILSFGGRTDVTQGRFRVDDGPVRKLEEGLFAVAAGHYPFFEDKRTSPIRGRAALPLAYVAGASSVTVQPSTKLKARTFPLDGLSQAVDAAKAAGCAMPG